MKTVGISYENNQISYEKFHMKTIEFHMKTVGFQMKNTLYRALPLFPRARLKPAHKPLPPRGAPAREAKSRSVAAVGGNMKHLRVRPRVAQSGAEIAHELSACERRAARETTPRRGGTDGESHVARPPPTRRVARVPLSWMRMSGAPNAANVGRTEYATSLLVLLSIDMFLRARTCISDVCTDDKDISARTRHQRAHAPADVAGEVVTEQGSPDQLSTGHRDLRRYNRGSTRRVRGERGEPNRVLTSSGSLRMSNRSKFIVWPKWSLRIGCAVPAGFFFALPFWLPQIGHISM